VEPVHLRLAQGRRVEHAPHLAAAERRDDLVRPAAVVRAGPLLVEDVGMPVAGDVRGTGSAETERRAANLISGSATPFHGDWKLFGRNGVCVHSVKPQRTFRGRSCP
jgi:hypothetical protein